MNELDKAIQVSGGVGALAKAIGVPRQNTISMWRKRGTVPLPWLRIIRNEILNPQHPPSQALHGVGATEKAVA